MPISAQYPLIVLAKDEGRFMVFASLDEAESNLEVIDVENAEYQAWDSLGRQAELSVNQEKPPKHWLEIKILSDQQDPSLHSMMVSFLTNRGITVDPATTLEHLITFLPRGWS